MGTRLHSVASQKVIICILIAVLCTSLVLVCPVLSFHSESAALYALLLSLQYNSIMQY
jgi:hypothetical protein